jgi:hypothetical protein
VPDRNPYAYNPPAHPCSTCRAVAGAPCRNYKGQRCAYHRARTEAAYVTAHPAPAQEQPAKSAPTLFD